MMDIRKLADAVDDVRATFGVQQSLGPDALPEAMSCGEANVMSDLFDALGLTDEAELLRKWHLYAEDPEEYREEHEHWPDWAELSAGRVEQPEDEPSELEESAQWRVIDNVTGHYVSQSYAAEELAIRLCNEMNREAGPGGRYSVRRAD